MKKYISFLSLGLLLLTGCQGGQMSQGKVAKTESQSSQASPQESQSSQQESQESRREDHSQSAQESNPSSSAESRSQAQADQPGDGLDKNEPAQDFSKSYFGQLREREIGALTHERNHPGQFVQSPWSAVFILYNHLKEQYPADEKLIEQNYRDFYTLLDYSDGRKWEEKFKAWAKGMGQSYDKEADRIFDPYVWLVQNLPGATFNGQAVKWNILGNTLVNDYDYLVLDAYYDSKTQYFYLFTLKDNQGQVFFAKTNPNKLSTADFRESENEELKSLFSDYVQSILYIP